MYIISFGCSCGNPPPARLQVVMHNISCDIIYILKWLVAWNEFLHWLCTCKLLLLSMYFMGAALSVICRESACCQGMSTLKNGQAHRCPWPSDFCVSDSGTLHELHHCHIAVTSLSHPARYNVTNKTMLQSAWALLIKHAVSVLCVCDKYNKHGFCV